MKNYNYVKKLCIQYTKQKTKVKMEYGINMKVIIYLEYYINI